MSIPEKYAVQHTAKGWHCVFPSMNVDAGPVYATEVAALDHLVRTCGVSRDDIVVLGVTYACEGTDATGQDCSWTGIPEEMDPIDDSWERVARGELMAAGQCPVCGCLISVDDADVPDYVLDDVALLMTARGWGVTPPSSPTPARRRRRGPRNAR